MILDDPREIARIDAGGMRDLVARFGRMTTEGWEAGAGVPLPPPGRAGGRTAVVVAGMGGSAIGGDLLRSLLSPAAAVPVIVVRDDRLPAFVGTETLAFVCSYSGETEETLATYDAARAAGASIVAVTSGGTLADRARSDGCATVRVPAGLPPRAALPYLFPSMLRVVARMGIARVDEADVHETATVLSNLAGRWGAAIATADNPSKQLAVRLVGSIPAIYAASQMTAPAAQRWKTQLNENSKMPALWNTFPELGHNETVGWAGAPPGSEGGPCVVILRDRDDSERTALQVSVTRRLAFGRARGVEEVWSQGSSRLARLLSLVLAGDFVSVYLAVLRGVDPTPVDVISRMKLAMQEAQQARGIV
ncbi:MAG: bifunctional phosphoglucose/phosphomannose isomerase [Armatimonadota bacterium]